MRTLRRVTVAQLTKSAVNGSAFSSWAGGRASPLCPSPVRTESVLRIAILLSSVPTPPIVTMTGWSTQYIPLGGAEGCSGESQRIARVGGAQPWCPIKPIVTLPLKGLRHSYVVRRCVVSTPRERHSRCGIAPAVLCVCCLHDSKGTPARMLPGSYTW